MSRMVWGLGLWKGATHACGVRQPPVCAVQALGEVERGWGRGRRWSLNGCVVHARATATSPADAAA